MKKIKTFAAACKAIGIAATLPDVSAIPADQQKAILAHYQLVIIAKALNGGWQPDWNNTDQPKYFPWFEVEASAKKTGGSGLSYFRYYASSNVGSRLCFQNWELAKYAGTQFRKLYEDYFLIR